MRVEALHETGELKQKMIRNFIVLGFFVFLFSILYFFFSPTNLLPDFISDLFSQMSWIPTIPNNKRERERERERVAEEN